MVSRIWEFVKRHKKKFIFLTTVAGGGWLLYKYIWKKVQEIKNEEDKQYLIHVRRQHHFDSNQRTCNMTVLSMVPSIRETLLRNLDTDNIKEMLKQSPANKLELWEELKIMSITRTLAAVYGTSMLSVMLRVQLNIVGGYMYLESIHRSNESKPNNYQAKKIPQSVQERYLSLVKQFIERGFVDFINHLKLSVMKEIGNVSLKEYLTVDNLTSIFAHIRERVECGVEQSTHSLYPYLISSEHVPDPELKTVISEEDELLDCLIGETRDILESNDFHLVLKESIDRGFHCILDRLADHYKQQLDVENSSTGIHEVSISMAKLIPIISSLLLKICGDAPNLFIQELLLMERLKQLAANVYEAFSQDPTEKPAI